MHAHRPARRFAAALILATAGLAAAAPPVLASPARPAAARPHRHHQPLRFITAPQAPHLPKGVRQLCRLPQRPGQMQCQVVVNPGVRASGSTGTRSAAALVNFPGFPPGLMQGVYGVAQEAAAAGSGETVAIVDAYDDPTAAYDLVQFRAAAGLPPCSDSSGTGTTDGCLTQLNQTGGAALPMPDITGGWEAEESLDLDMVSTMCPHCHLLLVEANSADISDLAVAENTAVALGAVAITNSWGSGSEFIGEQSFDSAFNHPGVAITAAAGDGGYGTQYPAVSPYVTAVGGTSLNGTSGPTIIWTQNSWKGSGSGCSVLEPEPSWQQTAGSPLTGCLNRTQNDVAADGDPGSPVGVYDTSPYQSGLNTGWNQLGGTSEAAAIIAAIYALGAPAEPGTYPASYPYQQPGALHDITMGSASGTCETNRAYLCHPETGYDGLTGWGTPNGIGPFTESLTGNVVTLEDPGTADYRVGSPVSLQIAGHDSGGQALAYSAAGLPAGLSISSSGLISGSPTAAGTATVTVTGTDATSASGSVSFTLVAVPSLRASFHPVAGPVHFGVSGICLDDAANGTADGTKIDVLKCDGLTQQKWTYLPGGSPGGAGTLTIHSRCLDATGTADLSGAVLSTCDGSAGQQWLLAGSGEVFNPASGLCLAGPASGAGGTQVWITGCAPAASQSWTLPASPVPSGIAGKCLDDYGNKTANGNKIQIYSCDGKAQQKWVLSPGGTLRVHGKCLDVYNSGTLIGAKAVLWSCTSGKASQQWLVGPGGELINARSGDCLADPGDKTANSTALKLGACYGRAGEIWAAT